MLLKQKFYSVKDKLVAFETQQYLVLCGVLIVALLLRACVFAYPSVDYTEWIQKWCTYIRSHDGLGALRGNFSDYNVPYLTLLALVLYLPIPGLMAVKLLSVSFDLTLALFAFLLVKSYTAGSWRPVLAACIVLLLPTVILNSSAWGQCDSIYATFCLGCIYCLCRRWSGRACIFFALALAFKLQAIFIAPVLLIFGWKRLMPWRCLLLIPLVFLLTLTPALLMGRNLWDLLLIYTVQTSEFDYVRLLVFNIANIYQWLPVPGSTAAFYWWKAAGTLITGVIVLVYMGVILKRRREMTIMFTVQVTLLFTLIIPFFLPEMHDRYFYLAEVFSTLFACINVRYYFLPVLMQVVSCFVYLWFFFSLSVVPITLLVLMPLLGIIFMSSEVWRERDWPEQANVTGAERTVVL